mmetsp:Transcript_65799/g.170830  ORF Transcript_65799/g.170830 Transcript_65799/m.170830 type:complete len:242 (-) Transcript_65799:460-1185(-)
MRVSSPSGRCTVRTSRLPALYTRNRCPSSVCRSSTGAVALRSRSGRGGAMPGASLRSEARAFCDRTAGVHEEGNRLPASSASKAGLLKSSCLASETSLSTCSSLRKWSRYAGLLSGGTKASPSSCLSDSPGQKTSRNSGSAAAGRPACAAPSRARKKALPGWKADARPTSELAWVAADKLMLSKLKSTPCGIRIAKPCTKARLGRKVGPRGCIGMSALEMRVGAATISCMGNLSKPICTPP